MKMRYKIWQCERQPKVMCLRIPSWSKTYDGLGAFGSAAAVILLNALVWVLSIRKVAGRKCMHFEARIVRSSVEEVILCIG